MNKLRFIVNSNMAQKGFYFLLFFFFGLLLFTSCKKEDEELGQPSNLHADYYQTTKGAFVIYQATEMTHDDAVGQHDTIEYQLKTVVSDIFIDNEGREANEFLRYKSYDEGVTFYLSDVYTTIVNGPRVELVEENQRIIKLFLPPSLNVEWNINAFNSRPEKKAYYEAIHQSYQVGNLSFDSTLNVVEQKLYSLVDYRQQYEVYAKGIGLVKKYFKDLRINDFDTLDAQRGNEIYYNVLSHGVE
ncbi:MAG: hypothetical protein ACI9G9_000632 [Psychromonas sp.]|jgi:hypothetical protein